MIDHVVVSQVARKELRNASYWWAKNRSADEAQRWYDGFLDALYRLETFADSHSLAAENEDFPLTIRELHYGLSARPTHRAVYIITDNQVVVIAIRHTSQDRMTMEDIDQNDLP